MLRLTGTTVINYPFKDQASDFNSALHWYFDIAEKSSNNWPADDTNQTSPPIFTQSIVSGTNRYKISTFGDLSNILKIECDDGTGVAQGLIPETLDSFGNVIGNTSGQIGQVGNGSFDDLYVNADSGIPTHSLKLGDYLYLRPKPNYNATNGLKAYINRPASLFQFIPISSINTTSELITTSSAHGLSAGDTVIFETDGTIPTGLTADTQYYVISTGLTTTDFKVSTTAGGSAVDISNAQTSSNHAVLQTSKVPGINSMHHPLLVDFAAVRFMENNNTNGVYNSRLQTLLPKLREDERKIAAFFAKRDKDIKKGLRAFFQNNH